MRKVFLAILLALMSNNAVAEWVALDIISDYFVAYADPATITQSGSRVQMLSLIDHKTVLSKAGKTFLSVKAQHEYDCAGARVRMLFSSVHSENMGKGAIISTDYKIDNWGVIQPLSIAASLWGVACGKR